MPSLAEIVLEGGRIRSDALRRNAEIVANQQRNSGLLWGSLLANTGQNIGQAVQHAQDVKAEQPMRDAQLAEQQQRLEMGRRQLGDDDAARVAAKQRAQLNQIALNSWEQSDDGSWNINQGKLVSDAKAAGVPFDPTALKPHLDALAAINKEAHDRQAAYLTKAVDVVHATGDSLDGFAQMVHGAQLNRYLREDEATGLIKKATEDPSKIPQMLDQLQGKQPKFAERDPTKDIYDQTTGKVVTPGTPAAPKPANSQSESFMLGGQQVKGDYVPGAAGQPGQYFYQGKDVTGQAKPIPSAAAVNLQMAGQTPTNPIDASRPDSASGNKVDKAIGITPNALYQGGLTFALKGTLPAGSRSMAAMPAQKAIQNKAAAIAEAAGVDLPQLQQEYAAASASTKSLTSRYQFTSTAAQAANENIAYALELSPTISRTDMPAVNRFTQWLQHETGGGGQLPQLSQFELALYTAAREYAKVTSGSAASISELSQTASQKVDQLINAAQTPDQFKAVTGAMQRDMTNVMGPMYRMLQNTNDVGPSLRKFMEFVGGGQGKQAGKKDSLGIR